MKYAYSFDKKYYDRFYGRRGPRQADRRATALLGDFICSYLRYLGQPVRSVLDIGCGRGLWRKVIAKHFPNVRYRGVEISEYLCDTYGWDFGSVVDFETSRSFDLVVCQDILQYLPAVEANAGIDNLAKLCRGPLYLSVLTTEDWEENCDRAQTDGQVYKRTASWYRRRLGRHFLNLGGGLFLSRSAPIVTWELEKLQ